MLTKIGYVLAMLCCVAFASYAQTSIKVGNGPGNRSVIAYDTSGPGLMFDNDDDGDFEVWLNGAGSVRFNGALMPNNNAGTSGDFLRSNGSGAPSWTSLQTLAWTTTGNAGTDSTKFLGTTDNKPLTIRTNNVSRAAFKGSTGGSDSGGFVPGADNVYSLGTSTNRWKDLYLGPSTLRMGAFTPSAHAGQQQQSVNEVAISYDMETNQLVIDKGVELSGSLLPNTTTIHSLGTDDNRWEELYLSGNSIHIGSSESEAVISFDGTLLNFSTDGVSEPEISMGGGAGAGMLGIGTTAVTSLDVNGDAAFHFSNLSLSNGANTGVDVGASSMVRIAGPTGAFEIHGVAGGQDGKVLELFNASGQTMRIMNQSASEGTAANRIVTGTGHSFEVRHLCGASLVYNADDDRWLMTGATRNTSTVGYSMKTYAAFSSSQNAFAPDYGYVCHRVSSNGNTSISGINSTGVQDGTLIILLNTGSSNIAIQNESNAAANAAYRIITGTGNNETLGPNKPSALIYDATSQRWRIISGR